MKKLKNVFIATMLVFSTLTTTNVYAADNYKLSIPCKFDYVSPFSEDLALARKEENLGYINKKGKFKIDINQYQDGGNFSEGLASVYDGNKYGFIDKDGKEVIPLEYDSTNEFQQGFAVVEKNALYGYIGKDGTALTPIQYRLATDFDEDGEALVLDNTTYKLINTKGETVATYPYTVVYPFSDGYAGYLGEFGYGYIDKEGKEAIVGTSDAVMYFSEGLAPIFNYPLWSFVNESKQTIATGFDSVDVFTEGMAKVSKNGEMLYINTKGEEVFKVDYAYSMPFSEGLSAVKKDDKGGFVDKTGAVVIPLEFDEVSSFSEGYAPVLKEGKWGFITSKLAVPYEENTDTENTDNTDATTTDTNTDEPKDTTDTTTETEGGVSDTAVMIAMFVIPLIMAFIAALLFKKRK